MLVKVSVSSYVSGGQRHQEGAKFEKDLNADYGYPSLKSREILSQMF